MREILFRGKRLDNGEWVYGYLVNKIFGSQPIIISMAYMGDDCFIEWEYEHIHPDTVGQYTGMTDRNGQKIFEGDIVEDGRDYNEEDGYGVVEWNDGAFEVISEGNWSGTFYTNYYGYEFNIIGNIHDNPDLLKGE